MITSEDMSLPPCCMCIIGFHLAPLAAKLLLTNRQISLSNPELGASKFYEDELTTILGYHARNINPVAGNYSYTPNSRVDGRFLYCPIDNIYMLSNVQLLDQRMQLENV